MSIIEKDYRRDYLYLQGLSSNVASKLTTRLFYEQSGTPIRRTPIGGECGANDIRDFGRNNRMGFMLTFRADRDGVGIDFNKLLHHTANADTQTTADAVEEFLNPGRLDLSTNRIYLPLFGQTLATLIYLYNQGQVTLGSLDNPNVVQLGNWSGIPTYWQRPITPEIVWKSIHELETMLNRAIFSPGLFNDPVDLRWLLETTHFFAASSLLSREYMGKIDD